MNFIVHHGDDDGICAAAIVVKECFPGTVTPETVFSYWHGDAYPAIPYDKITDKDALYLVDLALDAMVLDAIRQFRTAAPNATIVHIDHHQTTFDALEALSDEDKTLMSTVIQFYKNGLSGCLLTWIWSCMRDDERKHPMDVWFDFTLNYTHVGFKPDDDGYDRMYNIPSIVRWINDWDVWTFEIQNTTEFHYGFMLEENKSPLNKDLWGPALNDRRIEYILDTKYVKPGAVILQYINEINKGALERAYVDDIAWKDANGKWQTAQILMLNATGNSMVFGDKIKEYPAVLLWHYSGRGHQFHYSLYSHEGGLDVSVIAKHYGGGGHVHASGFQSEYEPAGLYGDALFAMEKDGLKWGVV